MSRAKIRECFEVRFVTVNPIWFDRGSDHEFSCKDFFQCYVNTEIEAQEEIEKLSRVLKENENEYGDDQSELGVNFTDIDHFYFKSVTIVY